MQNPPSASPTSDSILAKALPFLGPGALAVRASYRRQRFSRHAHDGYALGVIEAGALAFRYRGSNLVAPAGSVNLVQPDVPHDGEPALPEGWRYRMLYLPPEALARVLPEGAALPSFRQGVIEAPGFAAMVAAAHRRILSPLASDLARETCVLALLATWIARYAAQAAPAHDPAPEPRAVRMALDILAARFRENVTLGELATAADLSPWHLARAITRHTGLPPHAHLLANRLRAARAALSGSERLADIAAATGFADQSHLTRAFVRRFGLTPGVYRKIVQNADA